MNKVIVYVEGDGEKLFFDTIKKEQSIFRNIEFVNLGSGQKIFKDNGGLNTKQINKRIDLSQKRENVKQIHFIGDLDNKDIQTLKREISIIEKKNGGFIKIFLEVKKLEARLLSDINNLQGILGNKGINYNKKITKPTDNINDPFELIKVLYKSKGKLYTKNSEERKIAKNFCFEEASRISNSINNFISYYKSEGFYR